MMFAKHCHFEHSFHVCIPHVTRVRRYTCYVISILPVTVIKNYIYFNSDVVFNVGVFHKLHFIIIITRPTRC